MRHIYCTQRHTRAEWIGRASLQRRQRPNYAEWTEARSNMKHKNLRRAQWVPWIDQAPKTTDTIVIENTALFLD
jgi:hypothetical protein